MYKEDKIISGIYSIRCKINNKIYIGASIHIYTRFHAHKTRFKQQNHWIPDFQQDWNLYGEDNFEFSIIEKTNDLKNREQFWIDYYDNKYNLSATVINLETKHFFVRSPHGEEFIVDNLTQFSKERGFNPTGLHAVANGLVRQYKKWYCRYLNDTHEDWLLRRKSNRKPCNYQITRKNGDIETCISITEFCKKYPQYHSSYIYQMCLGKAKSHKDIIKVEKIDAQP